jgi:hypothetical protein
MACELHVHTRDAEPPLTFEQHHTTPQSWQLFAINVADGGVDAARAVGPEVYEQLAVSSSLGLARIGLYDPRTTELARTCHGNVHYWIVKLMRYAADATPGEIDARNLEAIIRSFRSKHGGIRTRVFAEAIEAPRRYIAAGHDLRELMRHGLWGQA